MKKSNYFGTALAPLKLEGYIQAQVAAPVVETTTERGFGRRKESTQSIRLDSLKIRKDKRNPNTKK